MGALLGGPNGQQNNNDPLGAILGGILSNTQVGVNQNGQIEVGLENGGFGGQQPTTTRRPPPVTTTTTDTTTTTVFGKLNNFGL